MAGIVFKTKFVSSSNKAFSKYIDYIDRPEAVMKENDFQYDLFYDYIGYMGNEEKTTGMFSRDRDELSLEEKKAYKDIFMKAQAAGSNMYQSVFSFEKDWIKEVGLMDQNGVLNSKRMYQYVRISMAALFRAEGIEGWPWCAAIHYNTDNIHVHISYVDPNVSWREGEGRCVRHPETGRLYQRGKFRQSSLDRAKGTFVNLALDLAEENRELNDLARSSIVQKASPEKASRKTMRMIKDLIPLLPSDMKYWKYNMNVLADVRPIIDEISDFILKTECRAEYAGFNQKLDEICSKYKESYGDNSRADSFRTTKTQDLYQRLGNRILKTAAAVDRSRKEGMKNRASERLSGLKDSQYMMDRAFSLLRKALKKDIESLKNQMIYEFTQEQNVQDISY